MKASNPTKKIKLPIEELREIRDKLSYEMEKMDSEKIKRFLKKKQTLLPEEVWEKQK